MDLLLCWLVGPVGLILALVGLSLLVERLARVALPWAMRPAFGMAVAIVLAQFGTATATTAPLTLPALALLAVAGFVVGRGLLSAPRPSRAELVVPGVVYLVFAAPFLISGEASWAGYIKLDDTATWDAMTAHVFEFGRAIPDTPASTHQLVLQDYLGGSYPIGGFVPAALLAWLTGQDVAFAMQPSMAVAAAIMALLLFELVRRIVDVRRIAAAIAVVGSLSSLLIGYYLWGGVKEMVVAALLPLAPLLAGWAARREWSAASWVPIGIAIAAMIVVLGPGGALWVAPTLLPAVVVIARREGLSVLVRRAAPILGFAALLILPVFVTPTGIFDPLNAGITAESEIGNLIGPIHPLQAAGIWPSLDFRNDPHVEPFVWGIAILCLLLAASAVLAAARLGEGDGIPLVGFVGGGALAVAVIVVFGSPWVDGKVMATISPGVLTAALAGIALLGQRHELRTEAAVLGTVVGGLVIWSAVLAYQGAWLAPRAPQAELEEIGDRYRDRGPALTTEASIYGPRHFLRWLLAEGASDRRVRRVQLADGGLPDSGVFVDLDAIAAPELDPYRLIVAPRSPLSSRPPAAFALVRRGKHFDVWERRSDAPPVREHLSLGGADDPGAVPDCAEVERLAGVASDGGELVAARVRDLLVVPLDGAAMPDGWSSYSPGTFSPSGSGSLSSELDVDPGRYEVWLGGEIFGALDIDVDGERFGTVRGVVNHGGAFERVGELELSGAPHELELAYGGTSWRPGSAAQPWGVGPLVLAAPEREDLGLVTVAPSEYRKLCGERWDWIEAIG